MKGTFKDKPVWIVTGELGQFRCREWARNGDTIYLGRDGVIVRNISELKPYKK